MKNQESADISSPTPCLHFDAPALHLRFVLAWRAHVAQKFISGQFFEISEQWIRKRRSVFRKKLSPVQIDPKMRKKKWTYLAERPKSPGS